MAYRWRTLPWLAGVAAAYAVLAKLVLELYSADGLITIFWPGAGLALAALLIGGNRFVPAIYAGAFAGAIWSGSPTDAAALLAAASTVEPLFARWLLGRHGHFDPGLGTAGDFYRLAGVAGLLGPAVAAPLGVGALLASGVIEPETYWRHVEIWWMGDTLGIILIAPLILVWRKAPRIRPAQYLEGVTVIGISFLVGQIVFLDSLHDIFGQINRGYWIYLLVTWAAIRLGPHGLSLVVIIATVQALVGAARGSGFFADDLQKTQLANFWAYTTILATVGMSLAIIFARLRSTDLALRESERELRRAQQLADLGRWSWNVIDDIHHWSEEIFAFYGRSPALPPATYPEVMQYFTPASWQRLSTAVDAALTAGTPYECDAEVVRPDGSRRWIVARGEAVRDADGRIVELHGTLQDITQRMLAETARRESEAQYRAVIETAADGFWMFDSEGRLLATNEAYARRSGYSRKELLSMGMTELEARESPDELRRHITRIRAEGCDLFETVLRTKGGECWPAEITASYSAETGGLFFAFIRDITERKRSADALRQSETRFRATFEQAAVGIAHVAPDGRFLRVNHKLCCIVGYSQDELLARKFQDITFPGDLEGDLSYIGQMLAGQIATYALVKRYLHKDGCIVWINLTVALVRTPGGSPDYFISVIEDISERKRTESALQALQAETERLTKFQIAAQTASAIAHELNQPLNAMAAYSEAALRLIRAGNPQPAKLLHAVESNAQQSERAGRVVRELMSFMHQGEFETAPTDLNQLIAGVLKRVEADGYAGVRFQLDLDARLDPVKANRLQIEKVLANLIENSIEAMRGAGIAVRAIAIQLRTAADAGLAQVTVIDSGPGIDSETLHRIFHPFFTTKPKGLGMGLAVSRAIVEAHGGQLWVESEPGAGAAFHFTLPFAS